MERPARATYSLRDAARIIGVRYDTIKAHLERTGEVFPGVRPIEYEGRLLVPRYALERAMGKRDESDAT